MKLEKAKEILKDLSYGVWHGDRQDFEDALKIGIKAIERLVEGRKADHAFAWKRLPGETEE